MGVDARLYLSTRWGLDDIKTVLERTQEKEVAIKSNHDISVGYYDFVVGERSISVFANNHTPIGSATVLMMRANDEAHKILKAVADVLGGILMKSDSDGLCELIEGAMYEEDGLPYFVKYAIVKDGIDAKDVDAFLVSKQEWHKRIEGKDIIDTALEAETES